MERTEIIEISSPGWRPRAHPIYHARSYSPSVMLIQLSKTSFEIHFYRAASKPKRVGQNASSYRQNKKSGRPFLVAARFLKPVCYSKTVRSPRARHDWRASAYL